MPASIDVLCVAHPIKTNPSHAHRTVNYKRNARRSTTQQGPTRSMIHHYHTHPPAHHPAGTVGVTVCYLCCYPVKQNAIPIVLVSLLVFRQAWRAYSLTGGKTPGAVLASRTLHLQGCGGVIGSREQRHWAERVFG